MVELEALPQNTYAPDNQIRPPTPPRVSTPNETRTGAFDRVFGTAKRLFRRTSSLTSLTPQSSAETPDTPKLSARKRVEWADLSGNDDVPTFNVEGSQIFSSPAAVLPPSSERKPPRSILKSTSQSTPDVSVFPSDTRDTGPAEKTFASMLESTTQQLAGGDRDAKVDAYVTLSRALKGHEGLVDLRMLKPKVDLILSFVKRDVAAKGDDARPEVSLALNALILLCSFFHTSSISDLIPLDFGVYIVELSIKVFEDPQASKDVARYLMFIMAKQSFPVKIMNQERVNRLLSALQNIESGNLTGKRITDGRTSIYRTLIRQSRPHMLANHTWLANLLADMTSKTKEIRMSAIALGFEAGYSLGTEPRMTRALSVLFQTDVFEKGKYGQVFIDRLSQMTQNEGGKDSSAPAAVAQVWSVIVLFFQGRVQLLERWEYLSQWLATISNAFNGSDIPARREALLAWNRLIFVVHANSASSSPGQTSNLVRLLPQALEGQLRRASMRANALNTLCCLLYYSLRPNNNPEQTDKYWTDYVIRLLWKPLSGADVTTNGKKSTMSSSEACTILRWLFDVDAQRNWSEHRIIENNFPAHELCPLDSKWVRRNASSVFPVVGGLLEQNFLDLGAESAGLGLWSAYIRSISLPAAKEIKVSNDTMSSLAAIYGFLYKVWRTGPEEISRTRSQTDGVSKTTKFLTAFESISMILINGLGTLPFTERQLCMGTQEIFTPIATPSQKPSKIRGESRTPLYHLILLLSRVSPNLEYHGSFGNMVHTLLEPFFIARKTKGNQIDLVKTILDDLPVENTEPCRAIWQVLAGKTTTIIDLRDKSIASSHGQPLGGLYRDLVRILEFGITLARNEPAPRWKSLFDAITCSAVLDAGDSAKALAVVEPLAGCLLKKDPTITPLARLLHFNLLVGQASYPRDQQALNSACKKIWGTLPVGHRSNSFDPYIRLYEFMKQSLTAAYTSFDKQNGLVYIGMFEAVSAFLKRCPSSIFLNLLSQIQDGIEPWIRDQAGKFAIGDELSISVASSWKAICGRLSEAQEIYPHSDMLEAHGNLLCSALGSRHLSVTNATIKFWNATFGLSTQHATIPDHLVDVLLQLRTIADVRLPSVAQDGILQNIAGGDHAINIHETQSELQLFRQAIASSHECQAVRTPDSNRHSVALQSTGSNHSSRPKSDKLKQGSGSGPKKTCGSTPKLQHDDSQIQFQIIDSSPISNRVIDSQVLTDRQKEVRARQMIDAALFDAVGPRLASQEPPVMDSDSELPKHRSTQFRASGQERKTTPTLATPSDDEDSFISSSPTPTRSLRSDVQDDESDSPPPKTKQSLVDISFDHIPSSPPQQNTELASGTSPSAQIDPFAVARSPIVSTYGSTVDFNEILSGARPSTDTKVKNLHAPSSDELDRNPVSVKPQTSEFEIHETSLDLAVSEESVMDTVGTPKSKRPVFNEIPSTPNLAKEARPIVEGSPASSDVFEDAISSPRLDHRNVSNKQTSSEVSGIDSSILRVLAEAELQQNAELEHERDQALEQQSAKTTPQVLIPQSLPKPLVVEETPAARQTRGHRPQSWSSTSVVLETPGLCLPSAKILTRPNSLSPEDTIVVDGEEVDEMPNSEKPNSKDRGKKSTGRKRKSDVNEDGERSVREESSQSSISSVRRTRGRPRKRQRASREPALEVGPTSSDLPVQIPQFKTEIGDLEHSSVLDVEMVEETELLGVEKATITGESSEDVFETSRDILESRSTTGESQVVMGVTEIDITRQVPGEALEPALTAMTSVEKRQPASHAIKSRLQSLINEMEGASLSKEEMNELEDMFEEAKCLLFAARLKGRKSGR